VREALSDPSVLGAAMPGDSWELWRAILIALAGEELTLSRRCANFLAMRLDGFHHVLALACCTVHARSSELGPP